MKKILNNWDTKNFTFGFTEEQYGLLKTTIEKYLHNLKITITNMKLPTQKDRWDACERSEEIYLGLLNEKKQLEDILNILKHYVKKKKEMCNNYEKENKFLKYKKIYI